MKRERASYLRFLWRAEEAGACAGRLAPQGQGAQQEGEQTGVSFHKHDGIEITVWSTAQSMKK